MIKLIIKYIRNVINVIACPGGVSAYKNNLKCCFGNVYLKDCAFIISGENNIIEIEDGCHLCGVRFYMTGNKNYIKIGAGTIVNASIKQPTYFNVCDGTRLIIEKGCLFSNLIEIHTTDYHKILSNDLQANCPEDVLVKEHTWVGLRTIILKGSVLPANSVIGACSLVNKRFDGTSNVIIAGNPAKIVKQNILWEH